MFKIQIGFWNFQRDYISQNKWPANDNLFMSFHTKVSSFSWKCRDVTSVQYSFQMDQLYVTFQTVGNREAIHWSPSP